MSAELRKLRGQVVREKAKYADGLVAGRPATNRAEREMSAAFTAAYTSVIWMIDRAVAKEEA